MSVMIIKTLRLCEEIPLDNLSIVKKIKET